MTTLAFDGKTFAADSQVTYDEMRVGSMDKIVKVIGGTLGSAGSSEDCLIVEAWFDAGRPEPKPVLTSFIGLFIPDDGSAPQEYNEKLVAMALPKNSPWVAGTGKRFALAAMLAGKTAPEAVEIAIKLDIYSGPPVLCHALPMKPAVKLGSFQDSSLLDAE